MHTSTPRICQKLCNRYCRACCIIVVTVLSTFIIARRSGVYSPIVGGSNACILHFVPWRQKSQCGMMHDCVYLPHISWMPHNGPRIQRIQRRVTVTNDRIIGTLVPILACNSVDIILLVRDIGKNVQI